jgi:putative membrane protein
MHPVAVIAAIVAALIHVWFFAMESVWFMRPGVWSRFGIASREQATVVRSFAYNQGFYNLFLAVGIGLGLWLGYSGEAVAGGAVLLFACGSMVVAGAVLYLYNHRFIGAALIQGLPPLVAILAIWFLR